MASLPRLKVLAPVIVLIVGLVSTLVAAAAAGTAERTAQTQEIAHQGEIVARLVADTVDLGIAQVRSLRAFFESSETVTAVEFGRFALYQGGSPGMTATGYAPIVPADRFDSVQEESRSERSQYVIVDVNRAVIDEAPGRDVVPVWYAYQHTVVPSLLGVDLASDPRRREAIERALARGRPVVSHYLETLGDPGRDYVEIYAPIDTTDGGLPGVVFATLAVPELVGEHTRDTLDGLALDIRDVTDGGAARVEDGPARWSTTVDVEDRVWEVTLTRQGGSGIPALALVVLTAGAGITLLVARITAMVSKSRSRRRELEDLKIVVKAKDVLLSSVAHELRTPLTSVVGLTALLADEWESIERSEVDELLRITNSEAADLADLVNDLLVAGRLEAGSVQFQYEDVDLGREVRQVANRISTDRRLEVGLPEHGPVVRADALRVRQIVRNILVNAVRHAETTVEVAAEIGDEQLILTIRNDGPAIPDHIAEVLFEPYQGGRDRPAKQGSIGLGLPVSSRLAAGMGGGLSYRYVDGWCTFTIRLPLPTPAGEAEVDHPATATA